MLDIIGITIGVVSTVVTIISIVVTVISIKHTNCNHKKDIKKSNRPTHHS